MFLKPVLKYIKSTGEHKTYYRLCESYRYQNTVRHHTIVQLGTLEELSGEDRRKSLVQRLASILKKERIDFIKGRNYQTIDTNTVENKDIREVGTEWMCAQAVEQLQNGISHKLFREKDILEQHLSKRTNELFDLHDTIYIYDLTNTYFEGQQKNSTLAQFGRSKEKRSDCKLIVLALVVNTEGNTMETKSNLRARRKVPFFTKQMMPLWLICILDYFFTGRTNLCRTQLQIQALRP